MLISLTRNQKSIDERAALAEKIFQEEGLDIRGMKSIADMQAGLGVYWCGCNFFACDFMEFENEMSVPYEQAYTSFDSLAYAGAYSLYRNQYGVADNLKQIIKYFRPWIRDQDRKFFITMAPVFQDKEEPLTGGWRWHKWGPYIGRLKPKYEYLNEEDFGPDFQGYVICFHIYEILP